MLLVRAALLSLACLGALWALVIGATEWRDRPLTRTSDKILAGGSFELAALRPTLDYIERTNADRTCTSGEPAGAAIIQHEALEDAVRQTAEPTTDPEGATRIERARRDIRRALACRPHQAYLWYALFRVEYIAKAPLEQSLPLLAMSYRLAPHEGWLMPQRNFAVAGIYDQLTPELQAHARAEFALLARDQVDEASVILVMIEDAPTRRALLSGVIDLPIENRRSLANRLDSYDFPLDVPGVDYYETQPWRKRS